MPARRIARDLWRAKPGRVFLASAEFEEVLSRKAGADFIRCS